MYENTWKEVAVIGAPLSSAYPDVSIAPGLPAGYDELLNEYQFRKFDNITYKTERRNNRYMLSEQDLKRFVIDFGEVDQQLQE